MAQFHPRYAGDNQAEIPAAAEEKAPKVGWFSRMRLAPALAVVASLLLVGGYITYLNIPNVSLRVAASRAGIEATMPGYKPDGFSLNGPIAWSTGQVVISFASNTDERNYDVIQRNSRWDSQSLLANYVLEETADYTTFEESGLTIYVFEGANATWVNGGVWYTIEGESLLNPDQLINIATSL